MIVGRMSNLGKKIVVVGVSAVGKSTFTRRLAAATGLPAIFADSIMWKPGWVHLTEEEGTKELGQLSAGVEWIIEGYIPKLARPSLFARADSIIYMDYPRRVASWRYIRR